MRARTLCAVVSLLPLAGCSRSIQVTVPDDFHGQVTIHCTSTGSATRDIQTDRLGNADASCPPISPTIKVLRAGRPVDIVGEPAWRETRDGEKMQVTFRVE